MLSKGSYSADSNLQRADIAPDIVSKIKNPKGKQFRQTNQDHTYHLNRTANNSLTFQEFRSVRKLYKTQINSITIVTLPHRNSLQEQWTTLQTTQSRDRQLQSQQSCCCYNMLCDMHILGFLMHFLCLNDDRMIPTLPTCSGSSSKVISLL